MTLVQRGLMPAPEPGAPGIFAMGDPQRVEALVSGAGFASQERDEIEFEWRYPGEDAIWENLTRIAGPLARVINALPDDERQATREAIFDALAGFRAGDGSYTIPASCWGVLAR